MKRWVGLIVFLAVGIGSIIGALDNWRLLAVRAHAWWQMPFACKLAFHVDDDMERCQSDDEVHIHCMVCGTLLRVRPWHDLSDDEQDAVLVSEGIAVE